MGKLINRIPGSYLLISSLSSSALRMHVESLSKPPDVNKASPGKLDIKRHSPGILYFLFSVYPFGLVIPSGFTRWFDTITLMCFVVHMNGVTYDTNLVFYLSVYRLF